MFLKRQGEASPSLPCKGVDRMRIFTKRLPAAKLCECLQLYSDSKPELLLCSKQCGLLIEAMQRVAVWLAHLERARAALPAPFVQDLFTLATKGLMLLEKCKQVSPTSWLTIAVSRMESREEFLDLVQGFLRTLKSYVEVMQESRPHLNTHKNPLSWLRLVSLAQQKVTCFHEVTSLIAAIDKDLHFLPLKAAEDRRAIFEKLEESSFMEGEESRASRFLMHRLEDKQMDTNALQLDSPIITYGRCLGSGTNGAVFKATWMGLSIAVKQFHHQVNLDAELKALLKTSHVNIMHTIGYVPEEGNTKPCLLMERMIGDLGHFVHKMKAEKSELPLSVCVEILRQIAEGMAHLHAKNIMHRDLKPENILFDRWPPMSMQDLHAERGYFTAKITDFGDARTQTYNTIQATAKRGTRCYRAPEILQQGDENGRTRYSNKVDVFSFGMVCYKLLTREDPHLSLGKALQDDWSELEFPPNCLSAFIFLARRCWASAHHKRPSFAEICDFLALFKSIVLNTMPVNGCVPPLYSGIRDDLLVRLVAFLGKEWLMEEAISLGIKLEFRDGTDRVEIDEGWLRLQVRNKLDALVEGDYWRWIGCCAGAPILIS